MNEVLDIRQEQLETFAAENELVLPENFILGPAMMKLTIKQRRFVIAVLQNSKFNNSEAARMAGYSCENERSFGVIACRLIHNPRIQAAIKELAENEIRSAAVVAMRGLIDIARNPTHKKHFDACRDILDRADVLLPEHKQTIRVEDNRTDAVVIENVRRLALELGIDPQRVLGKAGVIEGQFVEVRSAPTEEGIDDFDIPG